MKLRIEYDGQSYQLDLGQRGTNTDYRLQGAEDASGTASVALVTPGVYSVLLKNRSFAIHLADVAECLETWTNGKRHLISVRDSRDLGEKTTAASATGRLELRSQMPGKIVKILVKQGDSVHSGQGLLVVEAMKMQNELVSPKDGVVSKISVFEGATVAAGDTLIIIE